MNLTLEVLQRLRRGQPFRVAVPLNDLTTFLSELTERRSVLPEIVIRRAQLGYDDALLDFAGTDNNWTLRANGDADRRPERAIRST